MFQEKLKCSEKECQKKCKQSIVMNIEQLSAQVHQCEECNSGVFKTNTVAAHTYQQISLLWAEVHNRTVGRLH